MIHRVFTVYDSKAHAFLLPFFATTADVAIRMFAQAVNEENSNFWRYPDDFTLFEIGSYDDLEAKLMPLETPHSLGLAIQYKKAQQIDMLPKK